ncbi:MAG: hypothetical protein ACJ77K_15380 [Bacteroidia bacterium]
MQLNYDYIVVGSGATGSIAAYALAEAGVTVAVLDVGLEDEQYKNLVPDKDFVSIRKGEKDQNVYFLGKNYEGIPWNTSRVGSQLTPPRNFLTELTEKFAPFNSDSFMPMESFAKGGLGGGWGLGCYAFSQKELQAVGLDPAKINPAYESVARHIGISGERDDAAPYCLGDVKTVQPVSGLEKNLQGIYSSYKKQKAGLNSKGIFVGRTALALLTEDKGDRSALKYRDMYFWTDKDRSAYRSWMTIDQLTGKPNFSYHKNCLVMKFREHDKGIDVHVKRTDTNEEQIFTCRKLILAPGVLGTARIVIRSFDHKKEQLPVICNPYCYIPCVQWRMLGKATEQFRAGLGQLMLFLDEKGDNFDVPMSTLYSYRSLLLFKLIKEAPLNYADARVIMQYLESSFTIAGLHHPERPSDSKFIRLKKSADTFSGDLLSGQYVLSGDEIALNLKREATIRWALHKLGCRPLKTVHTPNGGSIHYAGTLPFNTNGELFSVYPNGRLAGTENVFVADGSGFNYLPAKGLTFTLMANAYNVAKNVLLNE